VLAQRLAAYYALYTLRMDESAGSDRDTLAISELDLAR
jgi:hypothetical protein